jgi:hypothetical protein
MQLPYQPMPLLKRAAPFDDPDWLFELKYDGFRALAVIEHGQVFSIRSAKVMEDVIRSASAGNRWRKTHSTKIKHRSCSNRLDTTPAADSHSLLL